MSQYGRLFTQSDVETLMLVAHIRGVKQGRGEGGKGIAERAQIIADFDAGRMTEEVEGMLAEMKRSPDGVSPHLTFPPDEPVFVLRASEPEAVTMLEELSYDNDGWAKPWAEPKDAFEEFHRWNVEHKRQRATG